MAKQMSRKRFMKKRVLNSEETLVEYHSFCKALREGDILYNMSPDNNWGELLIVATKTIVVMGDKETYSILLLGLKMEGGTIVSNGKRVDLTPQKVYSLPYLCTVGHCEFTLVPDIENYKVNQGLIVVCKNTDIWKYTRTHPRKPKVSKYGDDGELEVKSTNNKSK